MATVPILEAPDPRPDWILPAVAVRRNAVRGAAPVERADIAGVAAFIEPGTDLAAEPPARRAGLAAGHARALVHHLAWGAALGRERARAPVAGDTLRAAD